MPFRYAPLYLLDWYWKKILLIYWWSSSIIKITERKHIERTFDSITVKCANAHSGIQLKYPGSTIVTRWARETGRKNLLWSPCETRESNEQDIYSSHHKHTHKPRHSELDRKTDEHTENSSKNCGCKLCARTRFVAIQKQKRNEHGIYDYASKLRERRTPNAIMDRNEKRPNEYAKNDTHWTAVAESDRGKKWIRNCKNVI